MLKPLESVPPEAVHRVALLHNVPPGELLIHEIYRSIQGESTFAGLPCVFVRSAVCDSRCAWCDTPHAFNQGERMTARRGSGPGPELQVRRSSRSPAASRSCRRTSIPLMSELAEAGKTVLLETSGAHDVAPIDPRVHIILDLKCPDSGESHRNRWANLDVLKPTDQIKFVIASRRDWDWAEATIRDHRLDGRFQCLVSGVFGAVEPIELVAWLLGSGLDRIRFQLQLHKLVWHPSMRGV